MFSIQLAVDWVLIIFRTFSLMAQIFARFRGEPWKAGISCLESIYKYNGQIFEFITRKIPKMSFNKILNNSNNELFVNKLLKN